MLCYADDIGLLEPSAKGLQKMMVTIPKGLTKLGLVVNPAKCAYIVFRNYVKQDGMTSSVTLFGHKFEHVKVFKHLSNILSDDMNIKSDVVRDFDAFLSHFNGITLSVTILI